MWLLQELPVQRTMIVGDDILKRYAVEYMMQPAIYNLSVMHDGMHILSLSFLFFFVMDVESSHVAVMGHGRGAAEI